MPPFPYVDHSIESSCVCVKLREHEIRSNHTPWTASAGFSACWLYRQLATATQHALSGRASARACSQVALKTRSVVLYSSDSLLIVGKDIGEYGEEGR